MVLSNISKHTKIGLPKVKAAHGCDWAKLLQAIPLIAAVMTLPSCQKNASEQGQDAARSQPPSTGTQAASQQQAVLPPPTAPEWEFSTTAPALARAYDANSVSADYKFKGHRFKISGFITGISTDLFGNAVIQLLGGVNEFLEPQAVLVNSEKPQVATLAKGAQITLICTGNGDIIKSPMMKDCVFAPPPEPPAPNPQQETRGVAVPPPAIFPEQPAQPPASQTRHQGAPSMPNVAPGQSLVPPPGSAPGY